MSLLEFTDRVFRFTSSKPMVSGSFVSLLKLAFRSSSDLCVIMNKKIKMQTN